MSTSSNGITLRSMATTCRVEEHTVELLLLLLFLRIFAELRAGESHLCHTIPK